MTDKIHIKIEDVGFIERLLGEDVFCVRFESVDPNAVFLAVSQYKLSDKRIIDTEINFVDNTGIWQLNLFYYRRKEDEKCQKMKKKKI